MASAAPTSTTLQSVHEPLRGRAVCRVRRVFSGYSDTHLRWATALSEVNATEYTPEQVRPARCPFVGLPPLRRRVLRYGHSNADTRPAHIFHLSSATQAPTPGRRSVRRCTDSTTAVGQPLRSLQVAYGLEQGQAGTLSLGKPTTECLSLRELHDTCRLR